MVVGRATEQDLAVLHRYLSPRAGRLFSPRDAETIVWVAKWRSHILGCAKSVHERDASSPWSGYWLHGLWVRQRYRGLGVGERLVRHRLEHARLEGVPQVLILVSEENERSIRLHQKLGFEMITIPALEPVLAVELDAVGKRHYTMRKTLTNPESPSEAAEPGPITA
jgi:ribosomal protein S18 acetylase RimI-like enzyme